MEKTSLSLVFLFSLTIILFCSSLGDAREMAKEEVNCIGGKCPEEVAPTMDAYETNASCRRDSDCMQFCPKGCKIVNCNFGTCFCSYLGDAREMTEEEVTCLGGECLSPEAPIKVTKRVCRKETECHKYCPNSCTSRGSACLCSCHKRQCFCAC